MTRFKTPLLSALCVTLALAGCGVGANTGLRGTVAGPGFTAMGADGAHKLVKIHFRDRDQLQDLDRHHVDLFENVDTARRTVDASLTPETEAYLKNKGVTYELLNRTQGLFGGSFPKGYQTVEQLNKDLEAVAAAHPNFVHLVSIGNSLEGRPINALEFTSHPGQGLPELRLQAGQHARELPPVELMSRLVHTLADGYGKDAQVTKLVDTRDIWVVPVVNPDGRLRVEGGSSMWRKNARNANSGGNGVDTNRNADDHWSEGDDSSYADDFRGSAPFSEPESQAIRDLCAKHHFTISLDLHCYAGMILWPPGYDDSVTKDDAAFHAIGDTLGKRVGYKAGTIARTIYNTYGDVSTWEYDAHGTLAFAAELADPGFNPSFSQVDKDWAGWKDNFLFLIDAAGNPRGGNPALRAFPSFSLRE